MAINAMCELLSSGKYGVFLLLGSAFQKRFPVFAETFAFRLKNPNKSAIIIYCIIMGKRKGKYNGR